MSAVIVPIHTPELFTAAVRSAAERLRGGGIVAVPTETVYGLAANALDPIAVTRIFEIKGRPSHNPLIVHVGSVEMAKSCVAAWPDLADRLATAFWPGPLTMVLPRSSVIPDIVTANGKTVGVRWPSHPFTQALIRACGFPLAAPSANPSSELSPTKADHVRKALGDKIELIVDGGPAGVGIESTVLDLSVTPPHVLRPGMIHAESLLTMTGSLQTGPRDSRVDLRSPGQLEKHYAPKAKLVVWRWEDEKELRSRAAELNVPINRVHVIAHRIIPARSDFGDVSIIPHDPEAFARALFAELHRCDEAGAASIIVELPPATAAWEAIHDRLKRAAR